MEFVKERDPGLGFQVYQKSVRLFELYQIYHLVTRKSHYIFPSMIDPLQYWNRALRTMDVFEDLVQYYIKTEDLGEI